MEIRKKYKFKNVDISYDQLLYKVGSYHYNWHYEIELLWLLTGEIEVNVEGNTFGLEEGDLLIINSNCGHATFASVPNSIAMRLYISPDFFTSQGLDLSKGRFEMNAVKERMNPLFDQLRQDLAKLQLLSESNSTNELSHNVLIFSIAEKMTKFFLSNTSKKSTYTVGQKKEFLDFAIQYIEDNFKSDITLELLAYHCNYSTPYLSKMFKSELGINFYEYLTRCRLQHSIRALATTEKKVATIALENGFSDVKALNKMFKKHFGTTPSEYRKQISPHIQEIDKTFKSDLNLEEKDLIEEKLLSYREFASQNGQNPCDICTSREYEYKYNDLVDNIRGIIQ
ncbi:AraC family transcriptional regulator [Enterococcus avium]|uniref:AraC family transcriptional regulator n=1 Tax=Enterococcus avium TaxID=33945 RepID=UPI00289170E0|nr:AraC family transcriptional regulator [Enterococcus avium]MDT2426829.1 AraC family transcriptional regulator [Enterococcus avium]